MPGQTSAAVLDIQDVYLAILHQGEVPDVGWHSLAYDSYLCEFILWTMVVLEAGRFLEVHHVERQWLYSLD